MSTPNQRPEKQSLDAAAASFGMTIDQYCAQVMRGLAKPKPLGWVGCVGLGFTAEVTSCRTWVGVCWSSGNVDRVPFTPNFIDPVAATFSYPTDIAAAVYDY